MQIDLWRGGDGALVLVEKEAQALLDANPVLQQFGLALSGPDAHKLALADQKLLQNTGRVAFGGGVAHKLALAFCDSPYIDNRTLVDSLEELTDIFYYYKNETAERLTDEELIAFMEKNFNGVCQGSFELLRTRELDALARLASGCEAEADALPEADEEDADE